MSDSKGPKYAKWKSESLDDLRKMPKPTLRMIIYRLGLKIRRKLDSSSRKTIRGYRGSVRGGHIPHHHPSASAAFRESYHHSPPTPPPFNPNVEFEREIAADSYFRDAGFDDLVK